MPKGVGCKCGWPLDSCNPDFSDGRCGRKQFERMPPESERKEETCFRCHQPIWIVYHGANSNHTVEGRARKQEQERALGALARLYADAPTAVALVCDGALDPSGRLLGEVRDAARNGGNAPTWSAGEYGDHVGSPPVASGDSDA